MNYEKRLIPKGMYCYTIKEIIKDPVYGVRIITNNCPYMISKKKFGIWVYYCRVTKVVSAEGNPNVLWDQVKCCGINDEIDEYPPIEKNNGPEI